MLIDNVNNESFCTLMYVFHEKKIVERKQEKEGKYSITHLIFTRDQQNQVGYLDTETTERTIRNHPGLTSCLEPIVLAL